MAGFDDPLPLPSTLTGSAGGAGARTDASSMGDWDPDRARRGYTNHIPAVLGQPRAGNEAAFALPVPSARPATSAGAGALSPAALGLLARINAADYLTASLDSREPGFAEVYDALLVPQWSTPFGRLLLSVFLTLPRLAGQQMLDVACGTGYPTLELARFLAQDCDVAGLDPWEEAILLARRRASDEWLRNVSFVCADVLEHGLPDGAFDTITCNLGLSSFADPVAALGAMWRLLRPGGQMVLTMPLQSTMREFLDTYYLTLRDLRLGTSQQALMGEINARPTIEHARQLVERAGFEVARVVTDSFALHYPGPRAFFTSPLIQTLYLSGWREHVPDLTVRRLVFNEVERRLQARAEATGGELVMTVPMLCLSAVRV